MEKQKLNLELVLNSSSQNIIWSAISTAEGMSHWLADQVKADGNKLTFIWGDLWRHHEIRTATILKKSKNNTIRFRWDDETDAKAYIELHMEKSELTGDYMLFITDFTVSEDMESLRDLWEDNLERLHRNTGI